MQVLSVVLDPMFRDAIQTFLNGDVLQCLIVLITEHVPGSQIAQHNDEFCDR